MSKEVFDICERLISQNKTPSIALVRSRLSRPLPLPIIVKAMSAFKKGESYAEKTKDQDDVLPEKTLEERVAELESQVEALILQIAVLQRK